jgi:DNA-binding response OmpR family regulator
MARRVLIVDDEPDVCTYLSTLLEQHGYAVDVAESVDSAREQLERAIPDVVCLDIMMPRKSGMKLYELIREDDRWKSVPVIIISGVVPTSEFEMRQFINNSRIPSPDGYLEKPVKVDEFVALIERLITDDKRSAGARSDSHG